MLASYYVRLCLHDAGCAAVQRAYCDWVLGLGDHVRLRQRRIQVGVDAGWNVDMLADGRSLRGRYGCIVETRASPTQFLLQFVHHDTAEPAILWHNVVRVSADGAGAVVEHAVGRTAPREVHLEPVAAPPNIIPLLIKLNGPDLVPTEIQDASRALMNAADAALLADYVLNTDRALPFLVLSPQSRPPVETLDGAITAKALSGMARVVRLDDDAAADAFTERLVARGANRKLGIWDGAARLYRTGASAADSPYHHPLWTRWRMERAPAERREEHLAGEVVRVLVRERIPPGFFDLISREDTRDRQEAARRLLAARAAASEVQEKTEAAEAAAAQLAGLKGRVSELEAALTASKSDWAQWAGEYEGLERRSKELEERLDEREEQIRDLQDEIRRKQTYQEQLTRQCEELRDATRQVHVDPSVRAAIVNTVGRDPTPEHSLLIVAALFPDRIVVLREALASARKASAFRRGKKLFDLLVKLAGGYYDAIRGRHGDHVAGAVFGASFAAVDSASTMGNKEARIARTRAYEGAELVMWKHLRIGTKDSVAESIRVHFEWSPSGDRIVIGHCGEHLYLPCA